MAMNATPSMGARAGAAHLRGARWHGGARYGGGARPRRQADAGPLGPPPARRPREGHLYHGRRCPWHRGHACRHAGPHLTPLQWLLRLIGFTASCPQSDWLCEPAADSASCSCTRGDQSELRPAFIAACGVSSSCCKAHALMARICSDFPSSTGHSKLWSRMGHGHRFSFICAGCSADTHCQIHPQCASTLPFRRCWAVPTIFLSPRANIAYSINTTMSVMSRTGLVT